MTAHLIATVAGGTLDQYDKASAAVFAKGLPQGLLHHACVQTDDGFMVVETWESESALQEFTGSDLFHQALGSSGMPQPDIQVRQVHNVQLGT